MKRVAALLLFALVASGCAISRVDAPISFKADRRLKVISPDQEADVTLPVTVKWEAKDFDLSNGNHFGVFVDKVPVGPEKVVRLTVCTEREKLPPQLGQNRKICKDDRKWIFFSDKPEYEFTCFEPRFTAPKRERNAHTVTIVLLDAENRRVGQAVTRVRFDVDDDDANECRGFGKALS